MHSRDLNAYAKQGNPFGEKLRVNNGLVENIVLIKSNVLQSVYSNVM